MVEQVWVFEIPNTAKAIFKEDGTEIFSVLLDFEKDNVIQYGDIMNVAAFESEEQINIFLAGYKGLANALVNRMK